MKLTRHPLILTTVLAGLTLLNTANAQEGPSHTPPPTGRPMVREQPQGRDSDSARPFAASRAGALLKLEAMHTARLQLFKTIEADTAQERARLLAVLKDDPK